MNLCSHYVNCFMLLQILCLVHSIFCVTIFAICFRVRNLPFGPYSDLMCRTGPREGQLGSCPGCKPVSVLGRLWNNSKYGISTVRFSTREGKNSEYIPCFEHKPLKYIRRSCPVPKNFEKYLSKERPIICLPGTPVCLGQALLLCTGIFLNMASDDFPTSH
jgi:hypothetical protein